ncbi:MAG TPA: O-methyltransferase [Candidatus Deferrimicrobium sp.]|nr:O-methyltransferase [Candidatus Deferrimicrobium sp.]
MFYPFELEKYLEELLPERDPLFTEMEELALQQTIPIVTPAVGNFLAWLLFTSGAKNILEIGTAIGYSTLWLAKAAEQTGGKITTIDMNLQRRKEALDYFSRAGVSEQILSLAGDARKVLPNLAETYDLVFIDAAKGEYLEYLELVYPLIAPGGVLVVDNVLFRGWVVPGTNFEPKYQRMVSGLREFLQKLNQNPEFITSLLPLSDGVTVSWRRK